MKKILSNSISVLTILFFIVGCSKDDDSTPLSSSKLFTSFELLTDDNKDLTEDITAVTINKSEKSITATLPYGSDITNLTPNIVVSTGATVNPTGAQDFSNPVTYTITAEDKSTITYVVTILIALNNEKQINSLLFLADDNTALNEDITATINEDEKTITATVPYGTNVTALVPSIELSEEATINPTGAQDFTEPVTYTVTAQDESTVKYTTTINIGASNEKQITAFQFTAANNESLTDDVITTIDEEAKTITATVPYGTDITNLTPSIEISEGATVTPEVAQNFTEPVTYTVTAQDESTVKYSTTINIEPNTEKKIISFVLTTDNNSILSDDVIATIDETSKNIVIEVSLGTDITALNPTLEISEEATISIEGKQDFTNPVTYTVTAQDGTTQSYKAKINFLLSQRDALLAIYNSNPDNSLGWDITSDDISTWRGVTIDEQGDVIELDLSSKGITILPSEIEHLTQLTHLNLNHNYGSNLDNSDGLTSIPKEIGLLKNLTSLSISDTDLSSIPKEIGQLTNLIELNLSYNELTSIPKEIGQLNNLERLNLFINHINSIPPEISQLNSLVELNLSQNNLSTIPPEIGQLDNLRALYLDSNMLTSIPKEIGQLNNLKTLLLDNNNLPSFPQGVEKLNKLNRLDIQNNKLTSIPSEIGQLTNLTVLRLSSNDLTSIATEIGQLTNLTNLNLNKNDLKTIPIEIGLLTNLSVLYLSENKLITIPPEIGQLTSLMTLNLGINNLPFIPETIGQLTVLDKLNLKSNELTSIPQVVCDLNINYLQIDEGVTCE